METFSSVTGPLVTDHRRIPLTNASDAEFCCFLWSAPEQTAEQTIEMSVIWDTIVLIMTSLLYGLSRPVPNTNKTQQRE